MAIEDIPNQSLFGKDYNAEEEERKKAELAAQGAMMGAGVGTQDPLLRSFEDSLLKGQSQNNPFGQEGIQAGQQFANNIRESRDLPASAFGQEPNPATFLPYADDVATPPASALSVFTPGGEVKPNVDVNAITPSPEMTTTSAVNTALNQEVPVGTVNTPSIGDFFFGAPTPEQAQKILDTQPTSPSQRENLQAIVGGEERPSSVSKGFDYLFGSPDVSGDPNILQKPSVILDPFTGKTIEKPTPFAYDIDPSAGMDMNQQAIANALAKTSGQSQETGQAQAATAPTGGLTTVGGASLSEFLSGQAMPEQGFTQEESPLGGRGVTLTQDQMNQLSAERESRIGADQAISDRDRRAARGDGISMADQVDMAKANARGATPREVARGNQVANALGVDLKTGQPLQTAGGLTFDQQLALRKQNFAEGKFDYELAKDAQATYTAGIEASQKATTEEAQADTAGRTMVSAISNMNDAMTRMGGRSGEFFGGGFFGKAASFMPGTSAYDQVADVEFLQSNVALNAMSELKELSPTGSTGFGALSEKELRVLTDKYANLNPFTSPGLFQSNLKQLQGEFNNMLDNAWNKHSKEYSPEAANAIYGNRGGSGATGAPGQAVPNDRNVASAADTLLSDPKYN